MQLTPRYGSDPILTLDGEPSAIAEPTIRQRRRLAEVLGDFTDAQWAAPSRCDAWTNRDVIAHLASTNTFWSFSLGQALKGHPTTFLATFDPVSGPAQLVAGTEGVPAAEIYDQFVTSNEAYLGLLESLDDADWSTLAEAPPGHLAISAVTHHALWDSWIHERDILLPLGLAPATEPDEIAATLRYAAALGPGYSVSKGRVDAGRLLISATGPELSAVIEIADHVHVRNAEPGDADTADLALSGDAVELAESLSMRAPLTQDIPDDTRWMVHGLAEVFDLT